MDTPSEYGTHQHKSKADGALEQLQSSTILININSFPVSPGWCVAATWLALHSLASKHLLICSFTLKTCFFYDYMADSELFSVNQHLNQAHSRGCQPN